MLRPKTILIYALAFFALGLSACSKKSSNSEGPQLGYYRDYAQRTLKAAKANNWETDCDIEDRETMLKVTAEVDKHAAEIREYLESKRSSKDSLGENVGGLYVHKDGEQTTSSKWSSDYRSWRKVALQIPKLETAAQWSKIGSRTSRLLLEDSERMGYGANYAVNPENFGTFEVAFEIINQCIKTKTCEVEMLAYEIQETISEFWWVKRLLGRIERSEKKDKSVHQLHATLKQTALRFHLIPFLGAKRISESVIEVPMEAGPLGSAKERLAELLEKKWKSEKLTVKVRWTSRLKDPLAYIIAFDPTKDFSASVFRDIRTLKLSASVSENTLTHEFGHILGFRDHYYTSYEYGDTCTYRFLSKPNDVMSDHDGKVTKAEWEALDRAYPVGGRTWKKDERLPVPAP